MNKVQTQISFEAAHRLYDVATYSEECRNNIHGHSYKMTVVVGRDHLNNAGMVVDFKLLKKVLRMIEDCYDHSCILKEGDPLCGPISKECKKVFIVAENPTAEWMAEYFGSLIEEELIAVDRELKVLSVAVQETENNIAIWQR